MYEGDGLKGKGKYLYGNMALEEWRIHKNGERHRRKRSRYNEEERKKRIRRREVNTWEERRSRRRK